MINCWILKFLETIKLIFEKNTLRIAFHEICCKFILTFKILQKHLFWMHVIILKLFFVVVCLTDWLRVLHFCFDEKFVFATPLCFVLHNNINTTVYKKAKQNKELLNCLIDILVFLGKEILAFRGHDEGRDSENGGLRGDDGIYVSIWHTPVCSSWHCYFVDTSSKIKNDLKSIAEVLTRTQSLFVIDPNG